MPQATIVVDKIVPPKPTKKRYTLVTPDEKLYGAMPPIAERMKVGGTYDVFYKEDHFGGKTYLVIEGSTEVAGAPKAAPQPAAAPVAKYGNQDMATAERIFVCGALNAVLSNPNLMPGELGATDIAGYVVSFREAWRLTFGAKDSVTTPAKVESRRDDMDDEIPFSGGR